jgi:hypothetical protein
MCGHGAGSKGCLCFFQEMVNKVYVGLRFTGENEVKNVYAVMAAYLDDLAVGRTRQRSIW